MRILLCAVQSFDARNDASSEHGYFSWQAFLNCVYDMQLPTDQGASTCVSARGHHEGTKQAQAHAVPCLYHALGAYTQPWLDLCLSEPPDQPPGRTAAQGTLG